MFLPQSLCKRPVMLEPDRRRHQKDLHQRQHSAFSHVLFFYSASHESGDSMSERLGDIRGSNCGRPVLAARHIDDIAAQWHTLLGSPGRT
jgi:hypothetical protein